MPLTVPLEHKLSRNDTMELMRGQFEATWFDPRRDVGAGPGRSPYRRRPIMWSVGEEGGAHKYVNERTVGVQQTGWAFVGQSRGWLPPPLRGLLWWAPDDSATAVRAPLYGSMSRIPPSFGDVVGPAPGAGVSYGSTADALTMSLDSAFWARRPVSTQAACDGSLTGRALLRAAGRRFRAADRPFRAGPPLSRGARAAHPAPPLAYGGGASL